VRERIFDAFGNAWTRDQRGAVHTTFVRTTSPVAEHDQRIGMMRFEGFEFGEASVAEGGSEAAELE
jgi:hypothetical protein